VATFSALQKVGEKSVATYITVAMTHLSEWIEENNEIPPSGRLVEQDTI
jgi:hypothetical protein